MKKKLLSLLTLLLCVCGGAWATDFTFDVSTDFNDLTNTQKDAVISNGIISGDNLINISFSNPGTDFQRDANGIKMRGASERNATITIDGSIVATISKVVLTYSGTKRNIVSTPSVERTDDDENKTMTWNFENVSSLTLSQNIGNTVITKIEVTYASTGISIVSALWDFTNGNPASLAEDAIGIEGKEADVASSVLGISMHINATNSAAYEDVQGKLNYRSANGDAQCNRGTIIQVPVKGTRDIVVLNPKSGGYTIAGGSEVTAKTTYTATSTDVSQGYVEIICSTSGYLYSIGVSQYSVAITPLYTKTTYVTTIPLDFSDIEGLKAYRASAAGSGSVTLTSVETVPVITPLVLIGTASTTYNVPVASSASPIGTNFLVAGDGTTVFDGTTYDYILYSDGLFYQIGSGTVAATKAYLHCDSDPTTGGSTRSLALNFEDETTGLKAIDNGQTTIENAVYDLQGRRVVQPQKGLYIINGKKIIIK